jgi:hypothetical protein
LIIHNDPLKKIEYQRVLLAIKANKSAILSWRAKGFILTMVKLSLLPFYIQIDTFDNSHFSWNSAKPELTIDSAR